MAVPRQQPSFDPRRYDAGRDGFIDLMELKLMMEKLGAPQTHLGLKSMIKEVDEDFDGQLSFRAVPADMCPAGPAGSGPLRGDSHLPSPGAQVASAPAERCLDS